MFLLRISCIAGEAKSCLYPYSNFFIALFIHFCWMCSAHSWELMAHNFKKTIINNIIKILLVWQQLFPNLDTYIIAEGWSENWFSVVLFQRRHLFGIHWALNHPSTSPNFVADHQFVLVLAGLARAVGWKTMVVRYAVRGCGGLIWGSMCAKWMSSLENHWKLIFWTAFVKKRTAITSAFTLYYNFWRPRKIWTLLFFGAWLTRSFILASCLLKVV